ncbi:MAG: RND transporter [Rickettsia endosymbiont of Haemaphysalis japonica]
MRGNYEVIDEAISGYLMRLPRSLWLLAMTIK